ncbi:MAG: alpha/beta hydrolase-fold protein, partial [Chitinophagaceae bacterium]
MPIMLAKMKLRCLLFITHLFVVLPTWSQVTFRITGLPANTPTAAKIYLAGTVNNWNPANTDFELKPDVNGIYQITIPNNSGTIQYKFTRGDWASVEANASGQDIPNRSLTISNLPQTVNITIQSWKDLFASTAAANVQILNNSFVMPQLSRTRKIWLYLPPDYASSTKRYPVIYMHDAQNVFDARTSFSGEWGVDEALNQLFNNGNYGAIVVGIDNGGGNRLNEYSPWVNTSYGGGEGDAYIEFIAQTLKPYIDANYRTLTGSANTCLFGSSMGALISLYGGVKYPQIFGKLGLFSPAYWFALNPLVQYIQNSTNSLSNLQLYHAAGTNESATMITHIQSISNALIAKGVSSSNMRLKNDADGAHSEWYWRREFPAAYQWLFATSPLPVVWNNISLIIENNCDAYIQWQVSQQVNHAFFTLEKSTNGTNFSSLNTDSSFSLNGYYKQQVVLSNTSNYFRIKQTDRDGNFGYSTTV